MGAKSMAFVLLFQSNAPSVCSGDPRLTTDNSAMIVIEGGERSRKFETKWTSNVQKLNLL